MSSQLNCSETQSSTRFSVVAWCQVYSAKAEYIKTIHAVASFGEVAMMGLEPTRTATIVARTNCELLCLSNKDMVVAFRYCPLFLRWVNVDSNHALGLIPS